MMTIEYEKALLRRKAERQVECGPTLTGIEPDIDRFTLRYELEVHKIELDMQHFELLQAREEQEEALQHYVDLFDYAPVGYFILDWGGKVLCANTSITALLGIPRGRLEGRPLLNLLSWEDIHTGTHFLDKLVIQGTARCEVAIRAAGKSPLLMQLLGVAVDREFRVALIDSASQSGVPPRPREGEREQTGQTPYRLAPPGIPVGFGESDATAPLAEVGYPEASREVLAPLAEILENIDQALDQDLTATTRGLLDSTRQSVLTLLAGVRGSGTV